MHRYNWCVCVYYDLTTLRLSEPNHNSLHSKWVRTVYRVNGIRCFCLIKMLKAVAAAPPPVETVTTPAPVYGSHNNNKDQRSRIIQVKKKTRTKKNRSKSQKKKRDAWTIVRYQKSFAWYIFPQPSILYYILSVDEAFFFLSFLPVK